MSVQPGKVDADQVFLLQDYEKPELFWRVHVRQGAVIRVQETEYGLNEHTHGILRQWVLAGRRTGMAFLSAARRDDFPDVPDYSQHLLILVNERMLGDGLATPRLRFQQGFFKRDISVQTDDGWSFLSHYRAPWLSEMLGRLVVNKDMPEYYPADFIERLVEIVRSNRRHWLVEP